MRIDRPDLKHVERVRICGDGPWKCDVTTAVSVADGAPMIALYVGRDEKMCVGTVSEAFRVGPDWQDKAKSAVGNIFIQLRAVQAPLQREDEEAIVGACARAVPRAIQDWLTGWARALVHCMDAAGAAEAWAMAEAELVLES